MRLMAAKSLIAHLKLKNHRKKQHLINAILGDTIAVAPDPSGAAAGTGSAAAAAAATGANISDAAPDVSDAVPGTHSPGISILWHGTDGDARRRNVFLQPNERPDPQSIRRLLVGLIQTGGIEMPRFLLECLDDPQHRLKKIRCGLDQMERTNVVRRTG